jgi:hypothetical protein
MNEGHGQIGVPVVPAQKILLDLEEVIPAVDVANGGNHVGRSQAP